MNLESLKRKSSLDTLTKTIESTEKLNETKRNDDADYWKPKIGEDGTGSAVIRFLPPVDSEELPYVKYYDHYFKNDTTGLWYIKKSRTTLGKTEKDPVSEYNSILWKQGDSGKELARKQSRRLNYVSNIYVVKDSVNPENDGKVFLYRYGKKIHDKLMQAMVPDEEMGEVGFSPFDPWGGANFRILAKKVKEFPNYDDSKFMKQAPLGSDEEILAICQQAKPLQPMIDPENFESYEDLKKTLDRVLGRDNENVSVVKKQNQKTVNNSDDDEPPFAVTKSLTSDDLSDIDEMLKDISFD